MMQEKEIRRLMESKMGSGAREVVHKKSLHDIYDIHLEDGRRVILKTCEENFVVNETVITNFMVEQGLPVPKVLVSDPTGGEFSQPYLIKEWVGGTKLGQLLQTVTEEEAVEIFRVVGQLFGRMNRLHHERSGLIQGTIDNTLPVSPNEYMFQAELVGGSGQRAVEEGWISEELHQRVLRLWEENMDYLKDHQSALISFSPFHWTIYLDQVDGQWQVTKLMAVGDVLWWDGACNVAFFKYPAFLEAKESWWQAFVQGHGEIPEMKRINLYLLLQIISAGVGTYMEPFGEENEAWKKQAFAKVEEIVEELELSEVGR